MGWSRAQETARRGLAGPARAPALRSVPCFPLRPVGCGISGTPIRRSRTTSSRCGRQPGPRVTLQEQRRLPAIPSGNKTARQHPGGLSMKGVRLARLDGGFGGDLFLSLGRGLRGDRLEVDLDLDVVAEQETTRLEPLVPGQVEVLAVQLRLGGEADPAIAPGILALAVEAGVERDLLRLPVDGDVAD